MGACYSKNTKGSRDNRTQKQKHRISELQEAKSEESALEKVPLTSSSENSEQKAELIATEELQLSSSNILTDILHVKQTEHSLAPSDSGIESIGAGAEDVLLVTRLKPDRECELGKLLEHQNIDAELGGHGRIDLSKTGYDRRLPDIHQEAGLSFGENNILQRTASTVDEAEQVSTCAGLSLGDFTTHSAVVGDASNHQPNSPNKGYAEVRLSADNLRLALTDNQNLAGSSWVAVSPSKVAAVNNQITGTYVLETYIKAPLAVCESLETNFTEPRSESLPNELAFAEHDNKLGVIGKPSGTIRETGLNGFNGISPEDLYLDLISSLNGETNTKLTEKRKDVTNANIADKPAQSSESLDSVEAIINSCSESLDFGSQDEVNKLSHSSSSITSGSTSSTSIKATKAGEESQLLDNAVLTTIDSVDCVVIPKETYQQMQQDLSLLRQQLVSLSSLMQESDGLDGEITDVEADLSS